jgi:hypothetical protein
MILTLVTPVASGVVNIPACSEIEQWVSPMPDRPPPGYNSGTATDIQAWTEKRNRIADDILSNEATTETFGSAFRNWDSAELKAVLAAMWVCQEDARKARRTTEERRLMMVRPHMTTVQQMKAGPRKPSNANQGTIAPPTTTTGTVDAASPSSNSHSGGECTAVNGWVSGVMSQAALVAKARSQEFKLGVHTIRDQERRDLLTDAATLAGFGKPISKWDQIDFQNGRDLIDRCRFAARKNANPELGNQLEVGRGFLMNHWQTTPKQKP